uniref:Cytochrome P450 n=1 Tax=Anopheles farauti TaxID=69004 RepID=A0A182QB16_9DIPT
MFHTLVQCVLFLVTVYWSRWWYTRRTVQLLKYLPGPRTYPFIGSMYVLPGMDTSLYLPALINLTGAYESPYCVWLGPVPVVIVSTAEHVRTILTAPETVEKASFYRFTPLRGIFSLPAHKWRIHRKVIQPSFKQSILRDFIPLFEKKANRMVQALSEIADSEQEFDIYRYTARCTLDMIFATTLGADMHIQDTPTAFGYLTVLEELFEIVTIRAVNIFLHPQWIYRWTAVYRKEVKALEEFFRPSKVVLAKNTSSESTPGMENGKHFNLVEHLKSSLDDKDDIEHELNTIIFAGNETSAMTVANTLLLLAMHPHVQEKLFAELNVHRESEVNYETLKNLNYLEMVLKESLRLLPIAAVVGRRTTAELVVGGHRLPANIDVIVDIYNIHRNPKYWGPDADCFRPERFESLRYDPYTLLPFSAGPRNCVGLRYAWISMKIMLLKVLTHYRIETDLRLEDLRMKIALTMKISNGHMVRLRSRK